MSSSIPAVVDAEQLGELMDERSDVRLLDVRTPGEYETMHIRGSYNVPLDLLGEHAREIQENVDEPVVLVCQSGSRARKAREALEGAKMPNLHVLEGGVNGWVSSDKPVNRGPERISMERQVRIAAGGMAALGGLLALTVNRRFGVLPAFVGSGLLFAGVTDTCGMAAVLSKLPYNRAASCDVDAMVSALKEGYEPAA
ncbi:MAG: rhodanese-like domain-containing protein [Rubrobacteraceae bacterium]